MWFLKCWHDTLGLIQKGEKGSSQGEKWYETGFLKRNEYLCIQSTLGSNFYSTKISRLIKNGECSTSLCRIDLNFWNLHQWNSKGYSFSMLKEHKEPTLSVQIQNHSSAINSLQNEWKCLQKALAWVFLGQSLMLCFGGTFAGKHFKSMPKSHHTKQTLTCPSVHHPLLQ